MIQTLYREQRTREDTLETVLDCYWSDCLPNPDAILKVACVDEILSFSNHCSLSVAERLHSFWGTVLLWSERDSIYV